MVLFSRYNGAIIETQMWKMSRGRPGHHRVGPALRPLLLFLHIVLSNCASAKPTRIAIVGGGLAGLGTAAQLISESEAPIEQLHVYDPAPPGAGGASAVAAGLLHPFTPRGREIWKGLAGFEATTALLKRVEAISGPCSSQSGLLRLALAEEKVVELQTSAAGGAGTLAQTWLSCDEASTLASVPVGGLGATHAPAAVSIDVPRYVRGLWALIQSEGRDADVAWKLGAVESLQPLLAAGYDAIVVAMGARTPELCGCEGLPLTPCRGQNLVLSNEARLSIPLISGKYLVPIDGGSRLLAGATFEYLDRDACHQPADETSAEAALMEPLGALHRSLSGEVVLGCQAGVRALPPRSHFGYVPIAGRLGRDEHRTSVGGTATATEVWMVGGLGSRGLIHHALVGGSVARALLRRDPCVIDEHVRRLQPRLDACTLWIRRHT